ncbi:MAG: hypothetical protein V1833_04290 [Elusimicrobiota bacterium]
MKKIDKKECKSKIIIEKTRNLPYFSINDLIAFKVNKNYLKILLSRLAKREMIRPLKRGCYVSMNYISELEKRNLLKDYLEFIAAILYSPSYLSLEYVLAEYNILTEFIQNFTLITKNKTKRLKNEFGIFNYHHIKDELFSGFNTIKMDNFFIYKATKAKALFDFLYLRKNILINEKTIDELRLNLDEFTKKDIAEFKKFVDLDSSKKIKEIFTTIFKGKV